MDYKSLALGGGSGYSEYKGYEDEVQALEDHARALKKISRYLKKVKETMNQLHGGRLK